MDAGTQEPNAHNQPDDETESAMADIIGAGTLADILKLYESEVRTIPAAGKDLTTDEQEACMARAEKTWGPVLHRLAVRAAQQAVARSLPYIFGTLSKINVKGGGDASLTFDCKTDQDGFHDMVDEVDSDCVLALVPKVQRAPEKPTPTAPAKPADPTLDMFNPDGTPKEPAPGHDDDPEQGGGDAPTGEVKGDDSATGGGNGPE